MLGYYIVFLIVLIIWLILNFWLGYYTLDNIITQVDGLTTEAEPIIKQYEDTAKALADLPSLNIYRQCIADGNTTGCCSNVVECNVITGDLGASSDDIIFLSSDPEGINCRVSHLNEVCDVYKPEYCLKCLENS